MARRSPSSPVSAHHRLMRTVVAIDHEDAKVQPTPEQLDKASRVFVRAGGSWEGLFKGSVDDLTLLKKTLKVAVESGLFDKAPRW